MTFRNLDNKASYAVDGLTYLWNSGDITTVPSNEQQLIANSASQYYGSSIAIGSGRIVVGSPADNNGEGSVYIYDLDGNLIQKIYASVNRDLFDFFGTSVAVGGGIIVVGSPNDETVGLNAGSIYIYDLNGNSISQITASDFSGNSYFGNSVSVGCNKIVVGSLGKNSNVGGAYIFDVDGTELKILADTNGTSGDEYGKSVSAGAGRIVVGSPNNNSEGSVFLYDINGSFLKEIVAFDPVNGKQFGYSVSVGSGRIVIGAYGDDIGANANQGSAYIYDLDGNLIKKITASDGGFDHRFGISVSVGSGRIVVGANNSDFNGSSSGSAYVFDLDGNLLAKILPTIGANTTDYFGNGVAVGEGKIAIGAIGDDNANGSDAGMVYVYDTSQVYTLYDAIDFNY
jgi:hypothetical protein